MSHAGAPSGDAAIEWSPKGGSRWRFLHRLGKIAEREADQAQKCRRQGKANASGQQFFGRWRHGETDAIKGAARDFRIEIKHETGCPNPGLIAGEAFGLTTESGQPRGRLHHPETFFAHEQVAIAQKAANTLIARLPGFFCNRLRKRRFPQRLRRGRRQDQEDTAGGIPAPEKTPDPPKSPEQDSSLRQSKATLSPHGLNAAGSDLASAHPSGKAGRNAPAFSRSI